MLVVYVVDVELNEVLVDDVDEVLLVLVLLVDVTV